MPAFVIDVPVPSMGATVSELTIVSIAVATGAQVTKGQKLAELESDKSAFDFESPVAGKILEIKGAAGAVMTSGQPLFRMQTDDAGAGHLAIAGASSGDTVAGVADPGRVSASPAAAKALQWTPRAVKLAQEAGLDHAKVTDIEATGPGGRVSGDDVVKYLAGRK